jgi:hypothetical protein
MNKVPHTFIGVGKLQDSASALDGGKGTKQFTDAQTVYRGHVAKIQQYLFMSVFHEIANKLM